MRFNISTTFVLAGLTSLIAGSALPESKGELVARQSRFPPSTTRAADRQVWVPGTYMNASEGQTGTSFPYGRVMYLCDDEQFGDCYDLYLYVDGGCVTMASAGLDNWVHSMQALRSNVICAFFLDAGCAQHAISVRDSSWPTLPRTSPKMIDNFSSVQCRIVA